MAKKGCFKGNNCGSNKLFYTQPFGGVSYNPDAQLWFDVLDTVGGITPSEKQAYSDFIDEWDGYGLLAKTYQILPLLLADATKNTKDMLLSFNSVNYGGITHAATGVTGDGVSGYIDAIINPLNDLQQDSVGVTFCSNTAAGNGIIDAGSYINFDTYFWMQIRDTFDNATLYLNDDAGGVANIANTSALGTFTFNRSSSTSKQMYRNGVLLGTLTRTSKPAPNLSLNLMRINPLASYSTREFNMWIVHESFDATEVSNAHMAITNLKNALGI